RGRGRALEEGVRPRPAAQAPPQNLEQRPRHKPRTEPRRSIGSAAYGVAAVNAADRRAQQGVGRRSVAPERLRRKAHKRDRRADHVAERRPAAARIPSVEALWRQAQPDDALLAADELQGCRGDLNDVGAAVGIEEVGAPEVVEERLAIVAIADDAIG